MVKFLLEQSVNVNSKDAYGKTALMKASSGRAKLLLDRGAHVNETNNSKKTALIEASWYGR